MPCLKPPKREGECAPSVRKGRCWVALHWAGTARTTSPLDKNARTCTTEPEETKHPILQRRYLVAERSSVRGWQDLRAVRSRKAICGAFRMHSAHILPKPAHFGYTAAICCHKLAIFPSEALSGIHEAKKLPRMAAREHISRAFFHRRAPGERISATSCQQSGIFVRAGLLPCHSSHTA